ncbi:AP-1 complex subunit beta-1 [Hondaea fermentalgiana]|uniref:AP-1 complex subunit beta-1 n=1 Tax=Hondaea fermentalgiana TaxID=2315210 RepID=A0A2R5GQG3_9STRA|nr:AP-1 complex subunit beta-1 [Hondaea fermentalgiana]|eukprot:GBG33090.1 AP-1 complex subunit beta-1 [Hondaea fermentalgiana]
MATPVPPPPPASAGGRDSSSKYFDTKRGEVTDLKALLRNQAVERDPRRKREVIKKVIAYMTLGIDVSSLFGEVVMASATTDLVLKKMCYLFLSTYAASNEELATLCINTMTRDCQDSDPLVRGLALRSLSSLGLVTVTEYLLPVLLKGLRDPAAYVRRNSVLAVLKLHNLDKAIVTENGLDDIVTKMLQDPDPQVSASSLMVVAEINIEQGGIQLDRALVIHLLNRIRDYNEWGQSFILHLLAKYRPESEEETFQIMNVLDSCLRVASSAVVLATTKIFLFYADSLRHIKDQIYMRLKQPTLTLMANPSPELRYSVLKHVEIMVTRCPGVFDSEFKLFYIHYNEPSPLKFTKLRILPELANETNIHELVHELTEYVQDVDPEISKRAIIAFGRIAVNIPAGADGIINQLLEFISNIDLDTVRTEAVNVIKDLLRKYPDRSADVLPALPRCLRVIENPTGKAAVIFLLGEFGADMRQTPYLLEGLIASYDDEVSVQVKAALLTAVCKVFFRRPPEVHAMLKRLLTTMLNDTSDTNLHDRALLYYRLLRHDVQEARRCITCAKSPVVEFAEERLSGLKQQLFEEFNTLSILYDKPAEQFVDEKHLETTSIPQLSFAAAAAANAAAAQAAQQNHAQSYDDTAQAYHGNDDDLLGVGGHASPSRQPWSLQANVTLDQETFQTKWEAADTAATLDLPLSSCPPADQVESLAAENRIYCMASGDLGHALKFFFFGRDSNDVLHLAEVQLEKASCQLTATVKSEDPTDAQTFADSFMASLGALL